MVQPHADAFALDLDFNGNPFWVWSSSVNLGGAENGGNVGWMYVSSSVNLGGAENGGNVGCFEHGGGAENGGNGDCFEHGGGGGALNGRGRDGSICIQS